MSNRIISYRGLLADGAQDTIPLHTNDGKTGYKVVKFQNMNNNPGSQLIEGVMKIYKIPQSTVDGVVNFGDGTLLAASYHEDNDSTAYSTSEVIIFDNEIFNQDIYITFKDMSTGQGMNYYIELEQVPLTEDQALVAIVKNLRNEQ